MEAGPGANGPPLLVPLHFVSWHLKLLSAIGGPSGDLPPNASHHYTRFICKVYDGKGSNFMLMTRGDLHCLTPRLAKRLYAFGPNPFLDDKLRMRTYYVSKLSRHPLANKIVHLNVFACVDVGRL